MPEQVIDNIKNPEYPILPLHIDTSVNMTDAFGDKKVGCAARYVFEYYKKRGAWVPCTREEIETTGAKIGAAFMNIKCLLEGHMLIKDKDNMVRPTHNFLTKSFLFFPAI